MRFLLLFLIFAHDSMMAYAHDEVSNADCNSLLGSLPIVTQKVVLDKDGKTLITPNGSHFRNFLMKTFKFGENDQYESVIYYPTQAPSPEKASAVVAFFHGMNASISHSGSMLNAMKSLSKIKNTEGHESIYREAIDLPGCGNNADICPLNTYEGIIDFYTQYLKKLRQRSLGKPLIAEGFCYSAGFLIEVNRRNPGLIDGLILTGLIIPDSKIMEFSIRLESKMYESGVLSKNPAVLTRADRAYAQLGWAHQEQPTNKTPTLLMIGQNDPFQSDEAKHEFLKMAENNPNSLKLIQVPHAGHGVLAPLKEHPESYILVMSEINQLISKFIK